MKKINEAFDCINCKKHIFPAEKTCRNHCPHCFASLHVDGDIPGDRNTDCQGIMYPTEYEIKSGELKILFECKKCKKQHRNKRANDDEVENLDGLIKKYKKEFHQN